MNKTKFTSLLGALVLLGGLFSCGGGDDTLTIDFWHTSGAGITNGYETAATNFAALVKENEGVNIKIKPSYQGGYSDVLSKVTSALAAGTAPTVTIAYPDHVADYISAENGTKGKYVVNLADLADDETIGFGKESWIGDSSSSDFITSFYQEGQDYVNEGMYSLPLMKSTEVMYYNLDLVSQFAKSYKSELNNENAIVSWLSGISWSDFMDFCTYIRNTWRNGGKDGYYVTWYDSDDNMFISQSYQRNIPYISIKDGKLSADFNNDKSKALLTELKGYHDNGILTTKGVSNAYSSKSFINMKCIFAIGSSGGAGYQDPSSSGFNYRVCEVPYSNNNKLYVTQGPTLTLLRNPGDSDSVNDQKVKYAWKFLKYITSKDINNSLCITDSQGYVPVRSSCYETQDYKDYLNEDSIYSTTAKVVINDVQGHYLVSPAIRGSADARTNVGGAVSSVLLNKKDVSTALQDAYNQTLLKA